MSHNFLIDIDFSKRDGRVYARIPNQLKDALKRSALRAGRNLNAELIARIAHSLEEHEFIHQLPNEVYDA